MSTTIRCLFFPFALVLSRWYTAHRWLHGASLWGVRGRGSFHLAQFYQYNHRLLDMECMDARKYAYSFLRFDDAHRDRLGGMYRVPPFNPNGLDTLLHEKWDAEGTWSHWQARRIRMDGAPTPEHVAACDLVDEFGPSFTMRSLRIPAGSRAVPGHRFRAVCGACGGYAHHAVRRRAGRHGGTQSYYTAFAMEPMPPKGDGVWEHIEYRVSLPAARGDEDLKFYFWNKESRRASGWMIWT